MSELDSQRNSQIDLKCKNSLSEAGFSLAELMLVAGFSGIVFSTASALLLSAVFLDASAVKNSALVQMKSEALTFLLQESAWKKILKQSAFDCLKESSASSCPAENLKFNVLDANGEVVVTGGDKSNGYTSAGVACENFPSQSCPMQWNISWAPFCVSSDCNPKQIIVNGTLVNSIARSQRGPASDPAEFNFTLIKNSSVEPVVVVFSTPTAELSSPEAFIVPNGVTSIDLRVWGGGGGGAASEGPAAGDGGGGGFVKATLKVTPGENLTMIVAQGGRAGQFESAQGGGGGGGGGFSAVKRGMENLLLSGGGGGGGASHPGVFGSRGGAGSSKNGESGPGRWGGGGGTNLSGGRGGTLCSGGGADAATHGHDGLSFQGGTGGFNGRANRYGLSLIFAHPCTGLNRIYNGLGGGGALGGLPGGAEGGTGVGYRGGGGGGGGLFGGGGGSGGVTRPSVAGGGGGGGSGLVSNFIMNGVELIQDSATHGSLAPFKSDRYYGLDAAARGGRGGVARGLGGAQGGNGRIVVTYFP